MAKITFHAGDFGTGQGSYTFGSIVVPSTWEPIAADALSEVDLATEDSVKRIGGTLGWGAVGGLALGPAGLLAGLLLGGRAKEVTFAAKLKDGRKFLGTTDSKTFTKLKAAVF